MPHLARFIPSLPTLDLTGALDILLVAFVVYEALMVVRGTRAGHILIGILTMVSAMPVKQVARMVDEHDTRLWRVVRRGPDEAAPGHTVRLRRPCQSYGVEPDDR